MDFVLLGGDLFHLASPSNYSIQKCIDLLKTYCLGDKPVQFEFLSDQSINFKNLSKPIVNYEDPNLNIAIPVFSIHGNHDDPSGIKCVSALDIIAGTGLINYFGKQDDLRQLDLTPILLQKGESKLALYGLSHIRDERMGRLFRDGKVSMKIMPNHEEWFNMLVLHQNRVPRGRKNFIPDKNLPDFLQLVVWGHEHDCFIEPELMPNGYYVTQPGRIFVLMRLSFKFLLTNYRILYNSSQSQCN